MVVRPSTNDQTLPISDLIRRPRLTIDQTPPTARFDQTLPTSSYFGIDSADVLDFGRRQCGRARLRKRDSADVLDFGSDSADVLDTPRLRKRPRVDSAL